MKPVSLKNQLSCAQRELAKREKFYPKWIRERKLNPHAAEAELRAMKAIVASLEKLVGLEETSDWYRAKSCLEVQKGLALGNDASTSAERF